MRVVHVITGLGDGGAEATLYRLCTHSEGISHVVISLTGPGKYGPLLEEAGVPVHCLGLSPTRPAVRPFMKLLSLLRDSDANVVQTWMYHADLLGGVAARIVGTNAVVWGVHNAMLAIGRSGMRTVMVARLCGALSRGVPSLIISCSERAAVENAGIGYDRRRFRVIPNGYDLNEFKPNSEARDRIRRELALDEGVPLIGTVGRFDPWKDHDTLLKSLSALRHLDFRCLLVGTGMDASNLELAEMVEREGLASRVLLLGRRDDIPAIMAALDLHVLSSSSEAFPNVLNEAMGCGTPCVTTDVGDARLIVGDTGWVVPPRNPEALATAIAGALASRSDTQAWTQRQQACRHRIASCYGIERMVANYAQVWAEVARIRA